MSTGVHENVDSSQSARAAADAPREISARIHGIHLTFRTAPSLFSPRHIDPGTLAMLSYVEFGAWDKVLDLGCGYGVVGILAAKRIGPQNVFLIDNDPTAIRYARLNAELNGVPQVQVIRSNGFEDFHEACFTMVLCNPPYHADFSVAKHFVHKAFNRLVLGGRMWMVTKRRGWYENKLRAVFGGVQVRKAGGYHVFMAIKKSFWWAKVEKRPAKKVATQNRPTVHHPRHVVH